MKKTIVFSKNITLLVVLAVTLHSCRTLNSSRMFKAPKDYAYVGITDTTKQEYRFSINDRFSFQMYTNDGFRLIDMSSIENGASNSQAIQGYNITFLIDGEGMAKMPVIGRVKIAGKTPRETELFLEGIYAKDYKRPFINVVALNKRVFVFNGTGSTGKVVPLLSNNTRLIEVLAEAGGITTTGKAYQIKIIRGDYNKPEVIKIDLSKIETVTQANMIMQNGDIVYVDARPQYIANIATQVVPITALLSSLVTLVALFRLIK
jgi:polysaccharide export outer membrane protein